MGHTDGRFMVVDHVRIDRDPDGQAVAAFWHQQILGGGLSRPPWSCCPAVVDGTEAARIGETVIAILEELLAKLFGTRDALPVRVRVDEETPKDKLMKGRK
ncbi:MAG: hypothetical protein ABJL67_24390 [Sulfitobacter sp.]